MTQTDIQTGLERLEQLCTRPYPVEPPRDSLRVNAVMWLSAVTGVGRQSVTPHLHGGSLEDKIRYEYNGADNFWALIGGAFDPALLRDKDVLDIGCGWGGKSIRYAETTGLKSITGFDLPGFFDASAAMQFAHHRGAENVEFATGFAEDMAFADDSFDVAIMEDVLEHVRDPHKVLAEAYRVLRPGGMLVARFPSFHGLFGHHLERAISLPALQHIIPIDVWARGLNHYLLHNRRNVSFEPFSKVVRTEFQPAVTDNLNGMTLESFRETAESSPFELVAMNLVAHPAPKTSHRAKRLYPIYRVLWRFNRLRELLSLSIVFVGRKPA